MSFSGIKFDLTMREYPSRAMTCFILKSCSCKIRIFKLCIEFYTLLYENLFFHRASIFSIFCIEPNSIPKLFLSSKGVTSENH